MTYYHTCPICGANLDPGERCDCEKEQDENDQRNDQEHPRAA